MLGWLDSIFGATNDTVQGTTIRINTEQVLAFRAMLNTEPRIRMYVGTGGSYGNQAATVNLLRRLTDAITADNLTYGYAGIVDVYYETAVMTLDKLYDLIPELHRQPNGQLNNATLNLIAYSADQPPANPVTFGFTGAVDWDTINFATTLNVDYFLQLEPYNYNHGEYIWFQSPRPKVDLRTVPELNDPSFARRVAYIPPSTYNAPNWADYANDPRAAILRYLMSDDVLSQVRVVVSYAIMPALGNVINSSPEEAATVLCGGLLAWQDDGSYRNAGPVVVMNVNRFGDENDPAPCEAIVDLLDGGMTRTEIANLNSRDPHIVERAQQIRQVYEARKAYMLSLNAARRFGYLNYPKNLQIVQGAVNGIAGQRNQVLFVQLGPVPQPLYYYALSRTNMVSLFEGANSTMAAINMGKPFLALPRSAGGVSPALYPNVNRGSFSSSPPIDALASAANQLNFSLMSWPTWRYQGRGPCADLGSFLQSLTDQVYAMDPIPRYFREVKEYYAVSAADKLNVSLAYLMNLYEQDHPPLAALSRVDPERRESAVPAVLSPSLTAPSVGDNPLNALYLELKEQVVIGQKLDLIPGVLAGGNIAEVILGILQGLSATLWLTVLKFEHDGEEGNITQIRLGGTTGVLQGLDVTNAITVVFDAPDGQLRSGVEFGSAGTWSIPGVPWIQMSAPFLRILVSDGQIPVVATLGGTYDPLGAKLQVLVPVVKDQWLTTATFERPYPSIDRAFQMAASVNLVQVLPPPLNTLVDLGLANVELYYDSAALSVPSLGFILRSNSDKPLPLVGKISLSDIEAQVAIVNPKTKLEVKASANGSFTIGTGPDAGVVVVGVQYPAFVFNGKLASGKIELRDLFELFLPGVVLDLVNLPFIDSFDFNYTQPTDNLSASMKLVFEPVWTFDFFGKALFTLEDVGFAIQRAKGDNSGSITATTTLLPDMENPLRVGIGAYYQGAGAWRFSIQQQEGTVFSINELLSQYLGNSWMTVVSFPDVTGLKLDLDWGKAQATSFEFAAATATPWTPISVLPDVTVTGKLKLGYRGASPPPAEIERQAISLLDPRSPSEIARLAPRADVPGTYGEIGADITLWNIKLGVSYDFNPEVKKLVVRWLVFVATLEQNNQGQTIATFSLDGRSVGELVETFVSWATGAAFGLAAPWSVLNGMTLNGVKLVYNFSLEQVSFSIDVGPMDFGLFKIKAIKLEYNPKSGERPVEITIDGSFVWQQGDNLKWDPTKPETTPAPPGGGNKYLDLRLAALGQHVTVPGLVDQKSVQGVIKMLRDLKVPSPPDIPVGGEGQPVFDAKNSWFVAFDFGVLKVEEPAPALARVGATALAEPVKPPVYFLQLSIVFNDPTLYALRIALDGPMAKIFAGLDFQIMYRQVSSTVGCYSAKIALPNVMRKFQIGVATITLPDFGIDVYTNGDFQVDVGFPWNQDFSRSFTIELIVYPGIPLLGSAGFYFGKLSSATTDKVPVRMTGWFNPVLVFGFGGQIGLGKSIEAGILRAGFSITVFGIIEGVIARWLPYEGATTDPNADQLQDGYYFSITGTMGIQGRLYGSIDFAIIRADVDVGIKIFARITFASYEDIPILASASVNVSVSVKINLGLFKITVSFSFSATVSATFVLKNPMKGPPPWGYGLSSKHAGLSDRYALSTRRRGRAADELYERRLARARSAAVDRHLRLARATEGFNWDNLLSGTTLNLQGYAAPVLTVAGDQATTAAEQEVCYVTSFFLVTPPPLHAESPELRRFEQATSKVRSPERALSARVAHAALARARQATSADAADTFEDLAVRVLQWAIAAGQSSPYTPDQVNGLVVGAAFLDGLLQYLSGATTPTPVPASAVESFLTRQTAILFAQTATQGSADAVFFPAPPGTRLEVADYGTWKGYDYTFGGYNTTGAGYLDALNAYFKELQVEVGAEGGSKAKSARAAGDAGPSIASYVFGDYFASLASQVVQAIRDGLSSFKMVLDDALTVQQITDWINKTGQLTGDDAVTPAQLFVANQDHPLSAAASGPLTIPGMRWQAPGGQSFDTIAQQPVFGGGFSGKALAEENQADAKIIAPSQTIVLGEKSWTTQSGDSLQSIAAGLGVDVGVLLDSTDVLRSGSLLLPMAVLAAPDFGYKVSDGDTLRDVAARFGVSLDGIADASTGVSHLFDSGADPNLDVPELAQFQVGALIDEARRTLALQNVGAMMSRYYLHGLRLPTAGLTANARGLFVTGGPGSYQYPPDLGLFALTGQAFPLPAIVDPNGGGSPPIFEYTLTRGEGEGWLSLGSQGSPSVTFELTDKGDYQRYSSVAKAAHAGPLAMGDTSLGRSQVAAVQPSRFPLSTEMTWQSPVAVLLPRQAVTPETPEPRLWLLPGALSDTPNDGGALPRFEPVLARTDHASGTTVDEAVRNYGFGTLITFAVRRSQPVAGSPTTERLYEIVGAPDRDIVLLERLLAQLGTNNGVFQQMQVLYRPAATGSDPKGYQMDAAQATLAGISQVNLSTDTKPPGDRALAEGAGRPANIINEPLDFLRLLWEASVTRQGGFYLGYSTGIGAGGSITGLPDFAFNDRGEAELAVLCLFTIDTPEGQNVASYMNVLATNEPLDTSDAALVARSVIVSTTTSPLDKTATLAGVAAAYYTGADLVVAKNPQAKLASGAQLSVSGGVYEVPPFAATPGGGLQAIADWFFTTVSAVKAANPERTSWPDPLPAYTAIALPSARVTMGTKYSNGALFTSFADVSAYFGAPLAELAAENAGAEGLFPENATLAVDVGPTDLSSIAKPGVAGVDLSRAAPPAIPDDPSSPDFGRIYLLNLFDLLGYRVAETPSFRESNWGLSGGPLDPASEPVADKIRAPRAQSEGAPWLYTRSVPYSGLAKSTPTPAGLPTTTASPYWGVGGLLQVELQWLDLFGNEILSDLDAQSAGSSSPLNFPPQLTGYTDRLLGLGQWPSVASAYRIAPSGGQPSIALSLVFDEGAYLGAPAEKIEQAIGIYSQILLQLGDPNGVTLRLSTTVTPGVESLLTTDQAAQIVSWVTAIYTWLTSLLPAAPVKARAAAATFDPSLDLSVPLDVTKLNDAQIFLVTASFTIARRAELVSGALASVAGVREATTKLSPYTGPLTTADSVQRDLTVFSADFTSAFAGVPGKSYRVAAGSTRDTLTTTDSRDVWAVQLGTTEGEAISYQVQNPGDPIQYAPRPISNKLASKARTAILPYKTGTVISPDDPPVYRAFTSIDLDQWMSTALTRVDELLTPKYVAPAQILQSKTGVNSMQAVLDAKKALADVLKGAMIAVFAGEDPTEPQLASIREVFRQQMLSTLGAFYTVRAGLQFQAKVSSAIRPTPDDRVAPSLYGDVVMNDIEGVNTRNGSISLTSPRLALGLAGEAPDPIRDLSFLLSGVGLDTKKVTLDLSFHGQAIEHEIDSAGEDGYRASSWLSFGDATSAADWPLTKALGTFDTPIVLRAFPETPSLLGHEAARDLDSPCHVPPARDAAARRPGAGLDCSRPGTYDPLKDVTRWSYRFRYSMQVHHVQDALHATVDFNIADPGGAGLAATAAPRDLVDDLAEVVEVYPQVLADLDRYLVPIDVGTTDADQIKNANAALLSAANMFEWIATTAKTGLAARSGRRDLSTAAPPVELVLTQDGVVKQGPNGPVEALRVTLDQGAPLPGGVGLPLVEVEPETYVCEVDSTFKTGRSFVYKDRQTGDYLPLEKGLHIAARGVVLPDMDILERQDAGTGICLKRNEELVDGRPSAEPFIYQTPLVELPAPLHPTIDSDAAVNLATLYSTGPDNPVTRSLSCQLSLLYEALFANAGTSSVTMTMTVYYEYSMNSELSKVRLPIYLLPPTAVALADGAKGIPLADLVALEVSGCAAWFAQHRPDTTSGTLLFDLGVMSDLTAQPMPILRLRALFVDLANIQPPLASGLSAV